jgi:8-oxo-dGTP pyrophosphatase MutT (NUDIX family)
VSGKVDASDAGFEEALRRELAEETGFDRFVAVLDLDWSVEFDGPDGRRWRLHAFGVELDGDRAPVLSPEHVAFEWLPPEVARSRLHYQDNRDAVTRLLERQLLEAPQP